MPSAMMSKSRNNSSALELSRRVFEFTNVDERIDGLQLVGGGVQLLASHVGGGVNDLALQVGVIHHVEVHDAERADARGSQIKRQRRTQSACADAEHLCRLQLQLPFHADFGHDQVPRVAQDLVVRERDGFGFDFGCGGHGNLFKFLD